MLEYLLIGEITKPQGVHGELKLRPATCDPDRFDGLETAYLKEGETYRPVKIAVRRVGDDAVFFRMEGVQTRNDAEEIYLRSDRPEGRSYRRYRNRRIDGCASAGRQRCLRVQWQTRRSACACAEIRCGKGRCSRRRDPFERRTHGGSSGIR